MKVPPRVTEGDLVVSRTQWIHRWLPFVIYCPIIIMSALSMGVWTHTGFVEAQDLIGTSRTGSLVAGQVACEFAGTKMASGALLEDMSPFHCRCNVRADGMPWGSVTEVDQWGRLVDEPTLTKVFDPWTGNTGDLYKQGNTPWKAGLDNLLEPCADHNGVERWCWKDHIADLHQSKRPVLPAGKHCAAYGATIGQTMAYVVIHFGEILSLMSYRMDSFFFAHMFSNRVYTGFLVFNLAALMTALYVPAVARVMELAPLTPMRLALAMSFAFLILVANEIAKVNFRKHRSALTEIEQVEAIRLSQGGPPRGHSSEEIKHLDEK